jgi:hypothetical protein
MGTGLKDDCSPLSGFEVMNAWSCWSIPPFMACLITHRFNFTVTFAAGAANDDDNGDESHF